MKAISILVYSIIASTLITTAQAQVNQTALSNICKNCIDQGKEFCPNSRFTEGYCCGENDFCPNQGVPCANNFELLQ
mgnify:CR=1 FL=1|jgi:uncharacterized low-complexity protein